MKTENILSKIPDYEYFMTLEELDESTFCLAEKYSDTVSVFEIGKSKEKRAIYCIKIGQGSDNALLIGCPHPNEPIGAMMLEAFSKILAEDEDLRRELDYTFYIVKAIDPDGLKKNERWLKGPFTYYNYARNYFRPAGSQQVEWTFPVQYKKMCFDEPIPETKALMKLIDEISPRFLYTLHNSGFSGAYWYTQSERGIGYLVEQLPKVPEKYNIFLKKGEPETPFCREYGDGIYQFVNVEDMYDYYAENLSEREAANLITWGGSSLSYANRNGNSCDGLIAEVGYFKSSYLQDSSLSGYTRRETVLVKCNAIEEFVEFSRIYKEEIKKYLPKDDQYILALEGLDESVLADVKAEKSLMESASEEYSRLATKAQWFDNCIAMPYMIALWYGVLASAAEKAVVIADEQGKVKLQRMIIETEEVLKNITDDLERQVPCEPFRIRDLVAYQLESGLLGAVAAKI